MKGRQLALGVQLPDAAQFETYFAGPNADALSVLRAYAASAPGNGLLVCGAAATGKTHLLHALTREASSRGLTVAYIPLRDFAAEGPQILAGLEDRGLLCLDDLQAVIEDSAWALAILRLIDTLRARHRHFAIACSVAPERIAGLPKDLATRLSACTLLGLKPLQDAERATLLRTRARARGLELPDDSVRWLLSHLPRDPATLIEALERLDQASLAEQRRLTLPFVQQVVQPLLQRELPLPDAGHTGPG